ncbi:Uncharacterised protein [Vibrio cholerae]|nr:Uncharacterised protein [Vibrio cholerae]
MLLVAEQVWQCRARSDLWSANGDADWKAPPNCAQHWRDQTPAHVRIPRALSCPPINLRLWRSFRPKQLALARGL